VRLPRLPPTAYRRITFLAVLALVFIVITGGAVRLTGSGLGCPDWPRCAEDRLVAPWEYHAMVEFVNRTITGLVSLAVMLAVLGSLLRRPRRRDLTLLSLGLVAGVVGQIVLGGLTVLFHLKPQFVMAHFLLSQVLVANAVILHHRAGQPDGRPLPRVPRELRLMGRAVLAGAALAIFLGTVVTASGPHGGDPDVERLGFFLPDVARLHGLSVVLFLGLTLLTLWRLRRASAPPDLLRAGEVLLAVSVAQAAVGWTQYFTGVPVLLVGIHLAGATAVWAAVVGFQLRFTQAVPAPAAGGAARAEHVLTQP
jgi:cytochrome c oxidase assembly protein subunit 15